MVISKYNIYIPVNNRFFVFNLASQALIELDKDIINLLESGDTFEQVLSPEEQDALYINGIIVDTHEFEVARLRSNVNSLRYDRSRLGVFLSLTNACNLNCTYCYQDKRKELKKQDYLTLENWEKMYNYFKAEIKKYNVKHFIVSLFGGEPMFNDEILKKVVADLRKLQNDQINVQLVMITNGTLFDEKNVDFFCNNIDTIQVSLDGIKEINDNFRIYPNGNGSFDTIIKNLKLIIAHNKGTNPCELCLRVNVNDETVEHAYKLVDYIISNELDRGLTSLQFHEIFSTQDDILKLGEKCNVKNVGLAKKINDLNFYVASKGIKLFKELGGPCIAKMSTGYAIDQDLNVYGCPGIIYSEVHGNLENNQIKILDKSWFDYYLDDPKCIDSCKYSPICYGGCNWARGKKEKDCMKEIYDVSIIARLQAYIMSKYEL